MCVVPDVAYCSQPTVESVCFVQQRKNSWKSYKEWIQLTPPHKMSRILLRICKIRSFICMLLVDGLIDLLLCLTLTHT